MPFELTDQERPYFGLNPVDPSWVPLPLEGATAWFDGPLLRKVVTPFYHDSTPGYTERDVSIGTTHQRTQVAPVRAGAKAKKLTLRSALDRKPEGFVFRADLSKQGKLWVAHDRTHHLLVEATGATTAAALRAWVSSYVASRGPGHLAEVAALTSAAPARIRARAGDLFTVKLPGGGFGYGQVVLDTAVLRRRVAVPSTMVSSMGGLLVNVFRHRGAMPQERIGTLREAGTFPSFLMSDWNLRHGQYPIFGRERIRVDDLEFPAWISNRGVSSRWFSMGLIERLVVLSKPAYDAYPLPSLSGGVWAEGLEKAIAGESITFQADLRHSADFPEVLRAAGFAPGTDYDAMCALAGVPDRAATLAMIS
jgi:hypothetical protein